MEVIRTPRNRYCGNNEFRIGTKIFLNIILIIKMILFITWISGSEIWKHLFFLKKKKTKTLYEEKNIRPKLYPIDF